MPYSHERTDAPTRCTRCGETKPAKAFNSRPQKANGLQSQCRACMTEAAQLRGGSIPRTPRIAGDSVRCPRCEQWLPKDMFWHGADGRPATYCTPCRADVGRAHRLQAEYGMTQEAYAGMVREQGGRCAICEESPAALHIDHCHAGGQVRALLCHGCNTGLGGFRDDPVRMRRAAAYAEAHR